jgi:UTP-glucose-1-phosphate uridylyltransferase
VKGVVEKPKPQDAPSTLCIIGRYILAPEIFGELERRERGAGMRSSSPTPWTACSAGCPSTP